MASTFSPAELNWKLSGGDPFDQEPLVDRDRVIAITTTGRVLVVDGPIGRGCSAGAKPAAAVCCR